MKVIDPTRKRYSASRGFSLLEVMIVIGVSSLVMLGVYECLSSGTERYEVESLYADMDIHGNFVLTDIVDDMRSGGLNTIDLTPTVKGNTRITFQKNEGYDTAAGAITWSQPISYEWRLDPRESDNGIDDDNDGRIDEGRVVRITQNAAGVQEETVLIEKVAHYLEGEKANGIDDNGNGLVDEQGLSFDLQGSVLYIRLTLEGVDSKARVWSFTVESSAQFRN